MLRHLHARLLEALLDDLELAVAVEVGEVGVMMSYAIGCAFCAYFPWVAGAIRIPFGPFL